MIQARNVAALSLFQKEQIAARWKNHRNRPAQTAFWQKTVTTRHVILLQQLVKNKKDDLISNDVQPGQSDGCHGAILCRCVVF